MIRIDRASGRAQNNLAGTRREFRGRGLATLLKSHSLRRAAELGATIAITDNEEENAPMLTVNTKLGYRPFARRLTWERTTADPDDACVASTQALSAPTSASAARGHDGHAVVHADDADLRVVVPRDRDLRQHVLGRAVRDDASLVEQDHPLGVLRGQRQVVHGGDERQRRLGAERVEELERLLLVADVERGGRLVEQDDARVLDERPGDDDALALATAERPEGALALPDRSSRSSTAAAASRSSADSRPSGPRCGVRPSRTYSATVSHGGVTGSWGTTASSRARSRRLSSFAGYAVQRDGALVRHQPGHGSEQRRLSSAVRPDQADPLSARDVEVHVAHDEAPAKGDAEAARRDRGHERPPRIVRRTSTKNGPPKNAVTTPIGSSAGESAVLAMTSASTRNPAPTTNESGSRPR